MLLAGPRPADLRRRPHRAGADRHRRAARVARGADARADEHRAARSTASSTRSRCPRTCATSPTCGRCTTTRSSSCATCGGATAAGTTASPTTCSPRRAPSRRASGSASPAASTRCWPAVAELADEGDLRLACHLVEHAVLAAPDAAEVHETRAHIYETRSDEAGVVDGAQPDASRSRSQQARQA